MEWSNYNYATQRIWDTPLAGAFFEVNIIDFFFLSFFVYMDFVKSLGQCLCLHNLYFFKLVVGAVCF